MNFSAPADKLRRLQKKFSRFPGREAELFGSGVPSNEIDGLKVASWAQWGWVGSEEGRIKVHGDIFTKQYDLINSKEENQRAVMSNKRI